MDCKRAISLLLSIVLTGCRDDSRESISDSRESISARSAEVVDVASEERLPAAIKTTQPIDWQHSVGIFIGIERFLPGNDRPEPVDYAADDATDLAYFFVKERPAELLPPTRTLLLLSGRPHKAQSLQRLQELQRDATVILAEGAVCLDAAMINRELDRHAPEVGRDGILILSIATHGMTVGNQQLLLTSDSALSQPKGVTTGRMLQALRGGPGRRLLLFVDACRTPQDGRPLAFEDVDLPAGYAILSASSPRRQALARAGNGLFTRAVLEGLHCGAAAGPDGSISPRELDAYVGPHVRAASNGRQQTEGRFAGGLGDIELVNCSTVRVAKMLAPRPNAHVIPRGDVTFRAFLPDLWATVLVCAASNGTCYNQNPGFTPLPAGNAKTTVRAWYGAPDSFHVYVALTADPNFLRDATAIDAVPLEQRAERMVYWLGPVDVTFDHNDNHNAKETR